MTQGIMSREKLARVALRAAVETRHEAEIALDAPICIYDFVELLETEVWFVGGSSFAGMYAKGHGQLFVPAERPAGRRAFTCAHEFAHHKFGHGSRVEELDFDQDDHEVPEEILANMYAGYLLMPRRAVDSAFQRRRIQPASAASTDVYAVACQLGVGYETLVKHLRWSLNLIGYSQMRDLLSVNPKEIRKVVLGQNTCPHMVLAGESWHKVAIDMEVGGCAVLPHRTCIRGVAARVVGDCQYGRVIEAIQPGIAQAICEERNWAAMMRVSRRQFTGRAAYRHLEDPDETSETT